MKNKILIFLSLLIITSACTATHVKNGTPETKEKVSFKAREYFLKGLFLQTEERYSEALVQFHKAQIFDTTSATIHNSLAESYMKLNEFEPAIYHLKKATNIQPDNLETQGLLGEIYFRQRKDVEAIAAYEKVLKLDPYDDNARNFLFFLYDKTQQPAAKAKLYEELLYIYGENKVVLTQIVEAYEAQDDFESAIQYLDKIIGIDSTDFEVYFNKGTFLERLKNYNEAILSYEKALELAPKDKDTIGRLAILYRSSNDYQKVIDLLEPKIDQFPNNSGFKVMLAECFYYMGEMDKAKEILTPLSQLKNSPWTVHDLIGRIDLENKNYEEALQHFNKVIELNNKNYIGWLFVGFTYIDMNKFNQAEQTYRNAVQIIDNHATLWTWLGISLQRQNKFMEAVEPLKKAILLDSLNINAYSSLTVVLAELKLFSQSDSVYEAAIKNIPNNALLLNNYAYSLSERDFNLDNALEMSRLSNELEPDNAAYLDTIGWVYFKLKEYKSAELYILKSLTLRPNSAVVLDHMGDVYYEIGNITEAKIFWKRSIEIQPDNQLILDKIANN